MSISQECTDCKANLYQSNSEYLWCQNIAGGKKSGPRKWSKVFHSSLLAFRYNNHLLSRSFLWSKEFLSRRKWPHTFGQMSAAFQAWLFNLLNSIRACKLHSNTRICKITRTNVIFTLLLLPKIFWHIRNDNRNYFENDLRNFGKKLRITLRV